MNEIWLQAEHAFNNRIIYSVFKTFWIRWAILLYSLDYVWSKLYIFQISFFLSRFILIIENNMFDFCIESVGGIYNNVKLLACILHCITLKGCQIQDIGCCICWFFICFFYFEKCDSFLINIYAQRIAWS